MTCIDCVYNDFGRDLKAFIRQRVADEMMAEDIFQDVLVKIQHQLRNLRDSNKLKSWIYQICRHTIVDYYRRKEATLTSTEILCVRSSFEEEQFRHNLSQCIHEMIAKLPAIYRQAVMLTTYDDLTQKEMGERLGLSVSGAKSRIQRARMKLKTELLNCCQIEFDLFGNIIDYFPREKKANTSF